MIGRNSSSFLGVSFSDRSITCAEVMVSGESRVVRRTATFAFTSDFSIDAPDAAGQALATFLQQKQFTANRAVVGVPARWLIAVEKDVPPADETTTRATLRLQAERLAVADSGEVIFDYVGQPKRGSAGKVLLVGMLRQRLDRIDRLMAAADITVSAVTSTGLTLSACLQGGTRGGGAKDGGVLALSRTGGEMIWRQDDLPRMLRHVAFSVNGHGVPPVTSLGAELKRAVALAQPNAANGREFLLMDGVGLAPAQVTELSDRLGVKVKLEDGLGAMGVQAAIESPADANADGSDALPAAQFAPAMALALSAARPQLLPMDFKRSRLAPAPVRKIGRRSVWAIALGATAVIGIASLLISVHLRQQEVDSMNEQLRVLKPDIAEAQQVVDRLKYGRGFFETRPPVLDSLREITQMFRDDDRIWVTSFIFRDTAKGQLAGKAADQRVVLSLLDRLKKNPNFLEVKLLDMREADARSREVSFSMSFGFRTAE